jgi:hypothetical protein
LGIGFHQLGNVAFFDYQRKYRWLANRPTTIVEVAFNKGSSIIHLPALLDSGSPHIFLPGKYLNRSGETVEVLLNILDEARQKQEIQISLPMRGAGLWGPKTTHAPVCATLNAPGFIKHSYTVYFEDINYAIIGTPMLFAKGGVCFRHHVYRSGICWRRPFS